MENTYTFLRELAGSWTLIAMMMFYITACLWVLSPKRRAANAEAAQIPFRNETLESAGDTDLDDTDNPRAHGATDQKKESV